MKSITFNGSDLGIFSTNATTAGHGHKKIKVELLYKGEYRVFSATTSNMPDYDDATDLEAEEKNEALFNLVSYQLEDQINEWLAEVAKK
jgi:hypothetical protein